MKVPLHSDTPAGLTTDPEIGFLHVDPIPDDATLRDLYRHEYYVRDKPVYLDKVARERGYWQKIWHIRLAAMARAVGSNGALLDVGAGGGFFLDDARQAGWSVAGVEPSLRCAAYAREHFGLALFEGYLAEFQSERRFDAIHMSLVLEHVRDPKSFVADAANLLRPGGVIWVEVPNDFNALQNVIVSQMNKPEWWVAPEHHLNYFNYHSLSRLLEWAGFAELDRMGSFPMEAFPLMGLDYVEDGAAGELAHGYRMNFESRILTAKPDLLIDLYRHLAHMGLGRTCNILGRKPT